MPGMPSCQSCLDAGYVMQDGEPYACHCDLGKAWAARRYTGSGPYASPHQLPPGGEVMARQAAREAAGIPVGALEGRAPIRAMLIDDETMSASLQWVARLLSCLDEGHPERKAAIEWLMKLPEQYRATMPPITAPARTSRSRTGRRSAAPVTPPGS